MQSNPLLAPVIIPGTEPYAPGTTEQEKEEMRNMLKYQKWGGAAMESCPVKVMMAGGMGFGLGGFVAMMSATFAYEDPLSRASQKLTGTGAQAKFIFKELGRNMWSSGKGFAKVGALYSGIECCIEGYRAKNDIWNGVWGGAVTGGILARNSGPMGTIFGAAGFAVFSGAIELFLRRAPSEED